MSRVPDIPGEQVPHRSDQEAWLKNHVARLCQLDNERFPGSQPVSFGRRDIDKLESEDYWVCEKSDGVRVLLLVHTDLASNSQGVYLIDRKNVYREVAGLYFPHHEFRDRPLRNTIVDGELVIDVDPRTQQETIRFLAFDCLVIDDQCVMSRTLDKRYGRLKDFFYKPHAQMLLDHPDMAKSQPFEVKVKDIAFSYAIDKLFTVDIPALQHGNDGLIYTCVNTPYSPGTDVHIMKWKPPSENSIDFKLVLRFPALKDKPSQPDFHAKPVFALHVWNGGDREGNYEPYDEMHVEDDEWEKLKASGEQVDDRIVEVCWDPTGAHWRRMRFRDDKQHGNHRSVVENIIQSIADGVEKDALLARSNAIRRAWKERHGQPQQPSNSIGSHSMPPPPAQPPAPRGPTTVGNGTFTTAVLRYGALAKSSLSKVAGPTVVAGMNR